MTIDAADATEQTSAAVAAAVAITLVAAGVAWVVAIERMSGMNMGVETRLASLASFALVWLSMAAMMLPGAVPAVVRRAPGWARAGGDRVQRRVSRRLDGRRRRGVRALPAARDRRRAIAIVALAQKLRAPNQAIDRSVALAIVGLGVLILVAPGSVPGLTPAM